MKKIAVGDLGEFWYADYKEPLVVFEGGYGYVGAVGKHDDGRLLCHYCGKLFDNLGGHAFRAHGLRAREYKQDVGLLQKSALVSERGRVKSMATAVRHKTEFRRRPNIATSQFKPGVLRPLGKGKESGQWNPERLNMTGRCYEQVLNVGRAVLRETGRLSEYAMGRRGVGPATIRMYFGTWENYRTAVGAEPVARRQWTDRQLLDGLRNLASELARTPFGSDLARYGLPTSRTYANHFGTYADACRRAGLDPNLPMPDGVASDVALLTAYATLGNVVAVAKQLHVSHVRLTRLFEQYGAPFIVALGRGRGRDSTARKEWAADMARRLAGMSEAA